MIHQNKTEPFLGFVISSQMGTQGWDGLGWAGCQHLELQGIGEAGENVKSYSLIKILYSFPFMHLRVFETSY